MAGSTCPSAAIIRSSSHSTASPMLTHSSIGRPASGAEALSDPKRELLPPARIRPASEPAVTAQPALESEYGPARSLRGLWSPAWRDRRRRRRRRQDKLGLRARLWGGGARPLGACHHDNEVHPTARWVSRQARRNNRHP